MPAVFMTNAAPIGQYPELEEGKAADLEVVAPAALALLPLRSGRFGG
jgi:cytosine/adenosine deaminase-related metal-dependent hydrolase